MQLVSITPIIKHPQHERRANLKVDMDLKTLISKYLETKENFKFDKNKIIQISTELQEKIDLS